MKNHLMKIHNQVVSNLPLIQAINNAITDSDPSEIEPQPLQVELAYRDDEIENHN